MWPWAESAALWKRAKEQAISKLKPRCGFGELTQRMMRLAWNYHESTVDRFLPFPYIWPRKSFILFLFQIVSHSIGTVSCSCHSMCQDALPVLCRPRPFLSWPVTKAWSGPGLTSPGTDKNQPQLLCLRRLLRANPILTYFLRSLLRRKRRTELSPVFFSETCHTHLMTKQRDKWIPRVAFECDWGRGLFISKAFLLNFINASESELLFWLLFVCQAYLSRLLWIRTCNWRHHAGFAEKLQGVNPHFFHF